jgi:hypothetical protein
MLSSLMETHRIAIERSNAGTDTAGGIKRVNWTALEGLDDLACTIQPLSSSERMLFAQRGLYLSHQVFLDDDYTRTLRANDRLTLLDDEGQETQIHFLIKGIFDEGGRQEITRLEVTEIRT